MNSPGDDRASPTALARRLVIAGKRDEAESVVAAMIAENFDLPIRNVAITADWSSLNSLNGTVDTEDGRRFFFKFHQEEGEEATVEEYYRAELLQRAGLPVDVPAMICRRPGHQILLYAFRRDRQLAAVCLQMERTGDERPLDDIVRLQRDLNRLTGEIYLATMHESNPTQSAAEPVHQLFHNRLVTPPANDRLAGRIARFYEGKPMALPGAELPWEVFVNLGWRINGLDYAHSLGDLLAESLIRLSPTRLADGGAVVAHGDAHNANVWIERREGSERLVLFDPAFAGEHVPALLADVKATFHNIFAHPFWLYHPVEGDERYRIEATIAGGRIVVEHNWTLPAPRRAFLAAKTALIWRPLLAELQRRRLLSADWQRIVRTALFCCPTLVMSLRAGAAHGATPGRSPAMSALSFAISVMAGSEPTNGSDVFSQFLAGVAPAGPG
jgi:Ser/Thr protein kinase RdoA (MazF antagonist)